MSFVALARNVLTATIERALAASIKAGNKDDVWLLASNADGIAAQIAARNVGVGTDFDDLMSVGRIAAAEYAATWVPRPLNEQTNPHAVCFPAAASDYIRSAVLEFVRRNRYSVVLPDSAFSGYGRVRDTERVTIAATLIAATVSIDSESTGRVDFAALNDYGVINDFFLDVLTDLRKLSHIQQKVMACVLADLTTADGAKATGLTQNAYGVTRHRATNKLKEFRANW
jgi:hypothetical protein